MSKEGGEPSLTLVHRWWDLRTLNKMGQLDLGDPISSMELAHGGGTLSVTAGNKVHFLDILRCVYLAIGHPPVPRPDVAEDV